MQDATVAPPQTASTFALVLTTNELLAFYAQTGLLPLDGVEADLEQMLADRAAAARIAAGADLLVARGLARRSAESLTFDNRLIALVGSAARPATACMLTRRLGDAAAVTIHLFQTPALTVALRPGDPGLTIMQPLVDAAVHAMLDDFLLGLCPVDQPPPLRIRMGGATVAGLFAAAGRAVDSASGDASDTAPDARGLLVAACAPPAEADAFLDDLRTRSVWSCIAADGLRTAPSAARSITVVNAATHCWLLHAAADASLALELTAVTAAHAAAAVRACALPAA